jgi:hypothetical protein
MAILGIPSGPRRPLAQIIHHGGTETRRKTQRGKKLQELQSASSPVQSASLEPRCRSFTSPSLRVSVPPWFLCFLNNSG